MGDITAIVYFDGGCWPNPGGDATFGVFIEADGKVILREGFYIGQGDDLSSNVAEYHGLIYALEFLKRGGYTGREIIVRGDSKLVINQMSGRWRIKKGLYIEAAAIAQKLVAEFADISFQWVPREQNELCDSLAAEALCREVPLQELL